METLLSPPKNVSTGAVNNRGSEIGRIPGRKLFYLLKTVKNDEKVSARKSVNITSAPRKSL